MNATPKEPSQPERTLEEVAKDLSERERRLLERVLKEYPAAYSRRGPATLAGSRDVGMSERAKPIEPHAH
jgi:hypothetical protein